MTSFREPEMRSSKMATGSGRAAIFHLHLTRDRKTRPILLPVMDFFYPGGIFACSLRLITYFSQWLMACYLHVVLFENFNCFIQMKFAAILFHCCGKLNTATFLFLPFVPNWCSEWKYIATTISCLTEAGIQSLLRGNDNFINIQKFRTYAPSE